MSVDIHSHHPPPSLLHIKQNYKLYYIIQAERDLTEDNSYCNGIHLANAIFVGVPTWNRVECLIGVYITLNCQFFRYSWRVTKNYHILYVRGRCRRLWEKKKKNIGISTIRNSWFRIMYIFVVFALASLRFSTIRECGNRAQCGKPFASYMDICMMFKVDVIYYIVIVTTI